MNYELRIGHKVIILVVRPDGLGNYPKMKAHLLMLKGIGCLSITEEDNFSFYVPHHVRKV